MINKKLLAFVGIFLATLLQADSHVPFNPHVEDQFIVNVKIVDEDRVIHFREKTVRDIIKSIHQNPELSDSTKQRINEFLLDWQKKPSLEYTMTHKLTMPSGIPETLSIILTCVNCLDIFLKRIEKH